MKQEKDLPVIHSNLLSEPAGWKQHYPTYHVIPGNRDILLAEYNTTSKILESDEKLFNSTTNVTQIIFSVLASLAIGGTSALSNTVPYVGQWQVILIFIILSCGYSLFSILTFANNCKAIIFAQRKIVVLRKMLGLDYGKLQLILPNKRLEGANNPFSIPLFNGFFSPGSYSLCIIVLFSDILTFLLIYNLLFRKPDLLAITNPLGFSISATQGSFALSLFWLIFLMIIIRQSLFDTNETYLLLRTKFYAKLLAVRLVPNFEYIIYRAKLAWCETERLDINTDVLASMLVFLEDKDFYIHGGISYKAIFRAVLGLIKIKRPSGGSTITQQLVRSLFIVDFSKKFRRKFLETLLAPWFETICTKQEIIKMYLSSVRFEKHVFGLPEAMKHFFGKVIQNPSRAEAFFLVERVSNVQSLILVNRIGDLIRQAYKQNFLSAKDVCELIKIYVDMMDKGLLKKEGSSVRDKLGSIYTSYSQKRAGEESSKTNS